MFFLNQQYIPNSMRSMKPAVDPTHCKVSTAAVGPRHSGGSAGAMQTRAYPLHDWAIIGVLTSHHAPFPVFPRACVSSGANRIHDTAHSCTVHMHAWEPQYPRFCSSLPVCCSSDGVDSNNCLSILKKIQYAAPMFWRFRQDIKTNNILAHVGKQYVFLSPFPDLRVCSHTCSTHLLSPNSQLKHKQTHTRQRKWWKGGPAVL